MSDFSEKDIFQERQVFLADLRKKVDEAFSNRRVEAFTPDGRSDVTTFRRNKDLGKKMKPIHGNTGVTITPSEEEPNEVSVSNPHDYKYLVQLAAEKLAGHYGYSQEWVRRTVDKTLEHEFEHHVPALGQKALNIKYDVKFLQDEKTGNIGFGASVSMSGNTRVGVLRRVFGAVRNKSKSDNSFLNGK